MIGFILSESEKEEIQGQFYAPYEFFNCVQDINDVWFLFLSEQDEVQVAQTEYAWVLELTQGEYVPKPTPPFPPM